MTTEELLAADPDDFPTLFSRLTPTEAEELLDQSIQRLRIEMQATAGRAQVVRELIICRPERVSKDAVLQIVETSLALWPINEHSPPVLASLLRLIGAAMEHAPDLPISVLEGVAAVFSTAGASADELLRRTSQTISQGRSASARAISAYTGRKSSHEVPVALTTLNIPLAGKHVLDDVRGDWYRDPWRWLEVKWLSQVSPSVVQERVLAGVPAPSLSLDVPKPKAGVRPASILSAIDRVAYQAMVDSVAPTLLSSLPAWVYGWRTRANSDGLYADNASEFSALLQTQASLRQGFRYVLKLDIQSFFETVRPNMVEATLSQRNLIDPSVTSAITKFLSRLEAVSKRKGLPQRCLASSIIAQGILHPIDSILEQMRRSSRLGLVRWMDDFEVYSNEIAVLEDVADAVAGTLDDQGLPVNVSKTYISECALSRDRLDDGFAQADEMLVPKLFDGRKTPARFELGKLSRSFTFKSMSLLRDWLSQILNDRSVEMIGYAADQVANLVKRAGKSTDYQKWFGESLQRHPLRTDWVPHAWSQMFPLKSDGSSHREMVDSYGDRIAAGRMPYALLPNALKQIGQWQSGDVLDYCRQAAKFAVHPFEMRAVGLAVANVTGAQYELRTWLGTTFETSIAMQALARYGLPQPRHPTPARQGAPNHPSAAAA